MNISNVKILFVGYGIDKKRKEAVSTNVFKRIELLKTIGYEASYISIGYKSFTKKGYYFGTSMGDSLIKRNKVINSLKRYIRNNNITHVHDVFVLPFSSYYFTKPLAEIMKNTAFIKEYFNDSGFSKNIHKETFIRMIANNSFFLGSINKSFDTLVTENKYLSKKLDAKYIPSVVSIKKLDRKSKKGKLKICFLGHPLSKKGVYEFPKLFSILSDDLKSKTTFDFALSNVGPKKKVEEILRRAIAKEDIDIVLSGEVKPNKYFREQDVFILPIQDEYGAVSTPNSILEAMEAGCLVAATDIRTLEGIVKDKKTGYLLKETGFKEMLKAIEYIINNRSKVRSLAKNARNKILRDYSLDNLEKHYKMLYE